jgi:hypothetical protein
MKRSVFALSLALLMMAFAKPASAGTITLSFNSVGVPPGDNGGQSYVTVISSTVASGSHLAISEFTVSGDGGFDGTYAVTGSVNGFGYLSFDTSTNFLEIIGGIASLGVSNGSSLLSGAGSFSNIAVTAPNCVAIPSHFCPMVTFDAGGTLEASLASALGLGTSMDVHSFNVAEGTGNDFPQFSADATATPVPEPTSMALLGTGLLFAARGARQFLKRS